MKLAAMTWTSLTERESAIAADESFLTAYRQTDRDLRIRHTKAACVLVLILMPAGSSLDYFVYPQHFWPFFAIRWLADLFILPIFALLFTGVGRRHINILSILWPMVPAASISWMIALSEGTASPYYAGLNLILLGVCTLLPYGLKDVATVCGLTIACYVAGCMAHLEWNDASEPIRLRDVFGNIYFIVLTSIITMTAAHYFSRRRIEDFQLRHRLDAQNRELNASYAKLAELDRLRSQFFANISHELRTPLTLIIAPIEDLLTGGRPLPPAAAEALGMARQNGLRLLKLINDLLEVARLEKGGGELKRESVDLGAFLPGMVDSMRFLAEAKGLTLICGRALGSVVLSADPARMEKVMLNLLTNAIKFTDRGGRIEARWRGEGDRAVIEVVDTGMGIPADALPRIFDRFHQVDGSSTRKYQGVGIGLALVKELVEEHGGEIAVASRIGVGTTFTMRLPMAPGATATMAPDQGEPDALQRIHRLAERRGALPVDGDVDGEIGQGDATILVVDDEPDMRRYLVSVLSTHHRVIQATDGPGALATARARRPDLILLDMMIPGLDGLDVCTALRADPVMATTRIILLTARIDEATKISALQRGADDFLTKPFSSVEVGARIATQLRTAALQRDLGRKVDEVQEAMRRLQDAEAQLVQSEKMNALGRMSAGLLHEINNPLNFTLTAIATAQASIPRGDADLHEILTDVADGMKRIKAIVSDLRSFATPSRGDDFDRVELGEPVAMALRLCADEVKGIRIERSFNEDALVWASKGQLTQVFVNLIVNAAKALSGRPDPVIAITAERRVGRLIVAVRDNGVGIGADTLPRIFDPFFTTRDVGQGMGLGLSVCDTIVRNHGGRMTARSEPGRWTEIGFDVAADTQEKSA